MISLVPAVVPDAPAIVRLRDNLARFQLERGQPQWSIGEVTVAAMAAQISRQEWFVWRHHEVIDATCRLLWADDMLWPEGGDAGYIHGLMVRRCRMGEGIGTALLAWAETRIRERGIALARLDCAMTSVTLRRWYASHGYLEVAPVRVPGHPEWGETARFEKRLSQSG
jgi:GNAT superfamily N-acetyltransferase